MSEEPKYLFLEGYRFAVRDLPEYGVRKGYQCMNCKSMVYHLKCPNDECYNFYTYVTYQSERSMDGQFWDMINRKVYMV